MTEITPEDFASLYRRFQSPIATLNCGQKCAPYNERGVPFCCDTAHIVPTAHQAEWDHLRSNTNLWHPWEADDPGDTIELQSQAQPGQVLIACQGHPQCQREFRALTCRAFPFFPYIDSQGAFLGISYYWDYEERCWVISNLQVVSQQYFEEFIDTFESLFQLVPNERENYAQYCEHTRTEFQRQGRAIPLLHRNGNVYMISPGNERKRRVARDQLPKFGPYEIAARLPFPGEDGT